VTGFALRQSRLFERDNVLTVGGAATKGGLLADYVVIDKEHER
jgi:hypothetical protein